MHLFMTTESELVSSNTPVGIYSRMMDIDLPLQQHIILMGDTASCLVEGALPNYFIKSDLDASASKPTTSLE